MATSLCCHQPNCACLCCYNLSPALLTKDTSAATICRWRCYNLSSVQLQSFPVGTASGPTLVAWYNMPVAMLQSAPGLPSTLLPKDTGAATICRWRCYNLFCRRRCYNPCTVGAAFVIVGAASILPRRRCERHGVSTIRPKALPAAVATSGA